MTTRDQDQEIETATCTRCGAQTDPEEAPPGQCAEGSARDPNHRWEETDDTDARTRSDGGMGTRQMLRPPEENPETVMDGRGPREW
jgi:hypothetical protein